MSEFMVTGEVGGCKMESVDDVKKIKIKIRSDNKRCVWGRECNGVRLNERDRQR